MLEVTSSTLEAVKAPVEERLRRVEQALEEMVPADFPPIDEVSGYVLSLRGKLLRPALLLLANDVGGRPSEEAVTLGAIVELLHVATLVHDDSVDHSVRRRGMPTVNARWTHQVAVIMGDYLYSRAVIEITALRNVEWIHLLARTANRMTIGEMRQLVAHDALAFSREDYFRLCDFKTASLMAVSCELGALAGEPALRSPLRDFGFRLGMAFQITDDLLDYTSQTSVTGKPTGQDLREHKVTLPLIEALPRMGAGEKRLVEELFADPDPADDLVMGVIEAVERNGGLEGAREAARVQTTRAHERLEGLPGGPGLEALQIAVDYVVGRGG
ncbi:MAG: polyprenyl synthetase family protein [Gemmatimonadota bacterium]